MKDPIPTEIRRVPENHLLRIIWTEGQVTELDYDELRGWCPCAVCQGHGVSEVKFHAPLKPVTPIGIEPVGHYGISIVWSDQHSTGIYRFDFLHRLGTGEVNRTGREACLPSPKYRKF